jgi:hypothetical protein
MKFYEIHPDSVANGPWWIIGLLFGLSMSLAGVFGYIVFQITLHEWNGDLVSRDIAPIVFAGIMLLFALFVSFCCVVEGVNKIRQEMWLKRLDKEFAQQVISS